MFLITWRRHRQSGFNVITGVRRWVKLFRGKGNNHTWSDFMQIGDRVMQWDAMWIKYVSNCANIFLLLKRHQKLARPLTMGWSIRLWEEGVQLGNQCNKLRHHRILNLRHIVPHPWLLQHREQSPVRSMVSFIHQDMHNVLILMPILTKRFHGESPKREKISMVERS